MSAHSKACSELGTVEHLSLIVGQHLPETTKCLCWHPGPESGHIPLQVGLNECRAPLKAAFVIVSKKALGEASSQPQSICSRRAGPANFGSGERSQFQVSNSASECLRRLVHEIHGRRTEQQKLTDFSARSTPAINQTTQRLEYVGKTFYLIKDYEPVAMLRKV